MSVAPVSERADGPQAGGVALHLLCVHAHPDDEASKGAATVARYRAEGIGSTLVTCTGGEAGEVINPAMQRPEVVAHLPEVRLEELRRAVEIIGYERLDLLGYHDSGMPDSEVNARPDNFWNAPLDEAAGRLVAIIRRDRPQVIVTYADDQRGYSHPDHLKVHDISVAAWERSGDPAWYPDAGAPWTPLKLYYSVWSRQRMLAIHEHLLGAGLESPYDREWLERWEEHHQDHRITTQVQVGEWYQVRTDALLAHATQVDPTEKFWFGVPHEVAATIEPYDSYILADSRVSTDPPEDDLFAGLR